MEEIKFVTTPPPEPSKPPEYERPHHPTKQDITEIKRYVRSGGYPLVIAYDLNVFPDEAMEILHSQLTGATCKVFGNKTAVPVPDELRRKIVDLRAQGLSFEKIAVITGRKKQTCVSVVWQNEHKK